MSKNSGAKFGFKIFGGIVCLFLYCEYFVYYVVLRNCDYPTLDPNANDTSIDYDDEEPVRALVIADTHLLGSRKGHWFDKLRREWQMHRAFQTAVYLHRPELVFVLGDVTDEGQYCSPDEFRYYTRRFRSLFAVPEGGTRMYVVAGNHDIGFHHSVTPYLNQRFVDGFNSSAVKLVTMRGNHFLMVNSMALEGDGCFLCKAAEQQLGRIEGMLKCAQGKGGCDPRARIRKYSRPIIMQHFPMYRVSDVDCDEPDEAPFPQKSQKYIEGKDCLSKGATYQLLKQIRPRLVMTGHSHHGCTRPLMNDEGVEITLPSFSWRNKDNPSYGLVVVVPNNYAFSKCMMPTESAVINAYMFGSTAFAIWIAYSFINGFRKKKLKYH